MSSPCAADDKECLAYEAFKLKCHFERSRGGTSLLGTSQIVFLVFISCLLVWRMIASHLANKRRLVRINEGKEEEYQQRLEERRTIASKTIFLDLGDGGPVDVWMFVLTKLPCLALLAGVGVPLFLSWEGFHQAMCINGATGQYPCTPDTWGTPMIVDMDFAAYVKTETRMQLYEDALKTAEQCRVDPAGAYDAQNERRLLASIKTASPYEGSARNLSTSLPSYNNAQDGSYTFPAESSDVYRRSLNGPTKYAKSGIRSDCTHPEHGLFVPCPLGMRPYWTLRIFYEAADDSDPEYGVFSEARLYEIKAFENELAIFPGYSQHDLKNGIFYQCWRLDGDTGECQPPTSPVNIFFSSQALNDDRTKLVGAFDGKGELKDIGKTLIAYGDQMDVFTDNDFYIPKTDDALDFKPENLKSVWTMSTFRGHGPGANKFKSNLYHNFLQRENNPQTRKYKTLRISWNEDYLTTYEVMDALVHDSWFAMGSFIFVAAFILVHLHSLFLSLAAIFGIVISFPAAYYFFFVVMSFRKMMILNFVALFLIMGIGADDVFVMFDAYNQAIAALGPRSSAGQRLRWAYMEAGSAMLVTTVTTAGSFYSNCMSEVVVVRQFGFFMGTVVVLNWVHVMVIFPSALLVYELWWARVWKKCCCCLHKNKVCVKCCASDIPMTDEEFEITQSQRNLLKALPVTSDEDTAASIENRHAKEVEDKSHEIEEQQKAKHSRLEERLAARKKAKSQDVPQESKAEKSNDSEKLHKMALTVFKQSPKLSGRAALLIRKKLARSKASNESPQQSVIDASAPLTFDLDEDDLSEGLAGNEHLDLDHLGAVERCFHNCFSPFLHRFRFISVLLTLSLSVFGGLMVVNNFTPGGPPTVFLEHHNQGRVQDIMSASGLGDVQDEDERIFTKSFPSTGGGSVVIPVCPGLDDEGIVSCNGNGTCDDQYLCSCVDGVAGYACDMKAQLDVDEYLSPEEYQYGLTQDYRGNDYSIVVENGQGSKNLRIFNKAHGDVEWEVQRYGAFSVSVSGESKSKGILKGLEYDHTYPNGKEDFVEITFIASTQIPRTDARILFTSVITGSQKTRDFPLQSKVPGLPQLTMIKFRLSGEVEARNLIEFIDIGESNDIITGRFSRSTRPNDCDYYEWNPITRDLILDISDDESLMLEEVRAKTQPDLCKNIYVMDCGIQSSASVPCVPITSLTHVSGNLLSESVNVPLYQLATSQALQTRHRVQVIMSGEYGNKTYNLFIKKMAKQRPKKVEIRHMRVTTDDSKAFVTASFSLPKYSSTEPCSREYEFQMNAFNMSTGLHLGSAESYPITDSCTGTSGLDCEVTYSMPKLTTADQDFRIKMNIVSKSKTHTSQNSVYHPSFGAFPLVRRKKPTLIASKIRNVSRHDGDNNDGAIILEIESGAIQPGGEAGISVSNNSICQARDAQSHEYLEQTAGVANENGGFDVLLTGLNSSRSYDIDCWTRNIHGKSESFENRTGWATNHLTLQGGVNRPSVEIKTGGQWNPTSQDTFAYSMSAELQYDVTLDYLLYDMRINCGCLEQPHTIGHSNFFKMGATLLHSLSITNISQDCIVTCTGSCNSSYGVSKTMWTVYGALSKRNKVVKLPSGPGINISMNDSEQSWQGTPGNYIYSVATTVIHDPQLINQALNYYVSCHCTEHPKSQGSSSISGTIATSDIYIYGINESISTNCTVSCKASYVSNPSVSVSNSWNITGNSTTHEQVVYTPNVVYMLKSPSHRVRTVHTVLHNDTSILTSYQYNISNSRYNITNNDVVVFLVKSSNSSGDPYHVECQFDSRVSDSWLVTQQDEYLVVFRSIDYQAIKTIYCSSINKAGHQTQGAIFRDTALGTRPFPPSIQNLESLKYVMIGNTTFAKVQFPAYTLDVKCEINGTLAQGTWSNQTFKWIGRPTSYNFENGEPYSFRCKRRNIIGWSDMSSIYIKVANTKPDPPQTVYHQSGRSFAARLPANFGGNSMLKLSCAACKIYPSWCPTGLNEQTNQCCSSSKEVIVDVSGRSTGSYVTVSFPQNLLPNGAEYLIGCRVKNDIGMFSDVTMQSTEVTMSKYLSSSMISSVSFSFSTENGIDEKMLTVDISSFQNENSFEAPIKVQCKPTHMSLSDCYNNDRICPEKCLLGAGECEATNQNGYSSLSPTFNESGFLIAALDSPSGCNVSGLSLGYNWNSIGSCSGVDELTSTCLPTCKANYTQHGEIACQSQIIQDSFHCKAPSNITFYNHEFDVSGHRGEYRFHCRVGNRKWSYYPTSEWSSNSNGHNVSEPPGEIVIENVTNGQSQVLKVWYQRINPSDDSAIYTCKLEDNTGALVSERKHNYSAGDTYTFMEFSNLSNEQLYTATCKLENRFGVGEYHGDASKVQVVGTLPTENTQFTISSSETDGASPTTGLLYMTLSSVDDGGAEPSVMDTGGRIQCRLDGLDATMVLRSYPFDTFSFPLLNGGQRYEVECRAQNRVREHTGAPYSQWVSVLNQTVTTRPGKPRNIEVERSNTVAGRLNFSFTNATNDGGLQASYECSADETDATGIVAGASSGNVTCPSTNCIYDGQQWKGIFADLTNGQHYKVKCRGTNDDGSGAYEYSDTSIVGTTQDTQTTFSLNSPQHGGDTPTTGTLSVTMTSVDDGGAEPSVMDTGGRIQCRLDGLDATMVLRSYPFDTFSFPLLNGGQRYEVECRAQNRVSNQLGAPYSQWVSVLNQTVTTRPGKPRNIEVERSNTVAGRLNFRFTNATNDGGLETNYSCVAMLGNSIVSNITFCPSRDCYVNTNQLWSGVFDSLIAGEFYTIRCHAVNIRGTSATVANLVSVAPITFPPKIADNRISSASIKTAHTLQNLSRLRVTFDESSYDTDAFIDTYGTFLCYQCRVLTLPDYYETCDSQDVLVHGLRISQTYGFSCRVNSSIGWSAWSSLKNITAQNVPRPPIIENYFGGLGDLTVEVGEVKNRLQETGIRDTPYAADFVECDLLKNGQVETIRKNLNTSTDIVFLDLETGSHDVRCRRQNQIGWSDWAVFDGSAFVYSPTDGTAMELTISFTQVLTRRIENQTKLRERIFDVLNLNDGSSFSLDHVTILRSSRRKIVIRIATEPNAMANSIGNRVTNFNGNSFTEYLGTGISSINGPNFISLDYRNSQLHKFICLSGPASGGDWITAIKCFDGADVEIDTSSLTYAYPDELDLQSHDYNILYVRPNSSEYLASISDFGSDADYNEWEEEKQTTLEVSLGCFIMKIEGAATKFRQVPDCNREDSITSLFYGLRTSPRRPATYGSERIKFTITAASNSYSDRSTYNIYTQAKDYSESTCLEDRSSPAVCNKLTGLQACPIGYKLFEIENATGAIKQCVHCPYVGKSECGNGQCTAMGCVCDSGFQGRFCMKRSCPDCGTHGQCIDMDGEGVCKCKESWTGSDCSTPVCENNCNNRGRCNERATCECIPGWDGNDCSRIVRVAEYEDTLALNFVLGFSTRGVQTDKNGLIPIKPVLVEDGKLSHWSSWSFLLYFLEESRKNPDLLIREESIREATWLEEFYEYSMNQTFHFKMNKKFYGARYPDFEEHFLAMGKDQSYIESWMKLLWYGTQRSARQLFKRSDTTKRLPGVSEPKAGETVKCTYEHVILNPFMKMDTNGDYIYDQIEFEQRLWSFLEVKGSSYRQKNFVGFRPGSRPGNFTGNSIEWVKVDLNVDVSRSSNAAQLAPIYSAWNTFIVSMNARCGHDAVGEVVMVSGKFTTMDQELSLISSTINGFMTSNLICFAAVLFFTGDIVISFYTMTAIFMIVVTLLGLLFGILGWTFGAIEAVGVTIFVGMSVDYCLHTAHAYSHSASKTRRGKVTDALTHMGISILGAFVTTAGSTLFLFPLGLMMFANTILAVVFSFFFLSSMLMACGPTGGCGNVVNILSCKALRDIGRQNDQMDDDQDSDNSDEDIDPDTLVGQIESTQAQEEAQKKLGLDLAKMEAHARLERRKMQRRASSKNKLKVVPVST